MRGEANALTAVQIMRVAANSSRSFGLVAVAMLIASAAGKPATASVLFLRHLPFTSITNALKGLPRIYGIQNGVGV
jgi:hypothetical protein